MSVETKLSGAQTFWLLTLFTTGMSLFLALAPAIRCAHNDAWISVLLSLLASAFLTFAVVRTALCYPGETLVQYSQRIAGRWIGRAISLLYLLHWTLLAGVVARQTGDFMMTSQFHRTPLWVFVISLVALAWYLLHGGIGSIGRAGLIIGPIVMAGLLMTMLFGLPDSHWMRLLPFYWANGGTAILQGALPVWSYTGNGVMVGMLVPFMKDPDRGGRLAVAGVAVSCLFLAGAAVQIVAVFGPDLPAAMWSPFFDLTRYTSVSSFMEEIEPFIIIFWVFTAFVRVSVFTFIASYGWSQFFGSSRFRPFLGAVALSAAAEAFVPSNIAYSSILYNRTIVAAWLGPVLFAAVPLLLWLVAAIRTRGRRAQG